MKRTLLAGIGLLAIGAPLVISQTGWAQGAPESLLPSASPPSRPASTPAPRPRPQPGQPGQPGGQTRPPAPSGGGQGGANPGAPNTDGDPFFVSNPVVQELPSSSGGSRSSSRGGARGGSSSGGFGSGGASAQGSFTLPRNLPSLEKLEAMDVDELDEFLGLKPKYDIPPAARRSLDRVGIIDSTEGGLPSQSLSRQPGSLVKAALRGTKGQLVSRWGHIMLRSALSSRLASPEDLDPVDFATMRINLLNRMGEFAVARAVAQDVDTSNWSPALTDAAMTAYLGTADVVGACPALRLQGSRDDPQWQMWKAICAAFAGENSRAESSLDKALRDEDIPDIDALLAQRYAGASNSGRRAVTIEWDDVDEITPWRFALASALGVPVPNNLDGLDQRFYRQARALSPLQSLQSRLDTANYASEQGILSSASVVDLYSFAYGVNKLDGPAPKIADLLRNAYGSPDPANRMEAIRKIWGDKVGLGSEGAPYAMSVLTAYAAARMPASEDFADDAAPLIASMLSAGLDRDAMAWGKVVPEGSQAWGLLALAQPVRKNAVSASAVEDFYDSDNSPGARRTGFLIAGLAGLERINLEQAAQLAVDSGHRLSGQSRWGKMIDRAAAVRNKALVAYLVGVGMQGDSWDQMTVRQLYHIVSALHKVGMGAEARMIAAEAVARA